MCGELVRARQEVNCQHRAGRESGACMRQVLLPGWVCLLAFFLAAPTASAFSNVHPVPLLAPVPAQLQPHLRTSEVFSSVVCRNRMPREGLHVELPQGGNRGGARERRPSVVQVVADEVSRNTRWIVSLTAAGILLFRRDAIAVSAIIGALGNAVLSKILKKVLKQERPEGAPINAETADPGMPSSHAMSLFFFCGYLCSATITWSGFPPAGIAASCVGLLGFAAYTARWRVTAGFHTAPQVIVGSLLGGFNGVGWQRLTDLHPALIAQGNELLRSNASLPWVLCALIVLGGGIVGWKSIKQLVGLPTTPKPATPKPPRDS